MKNRILVTAALKAELPKIDNAVVTGFGKERTKNTLNSILSNGTPSLVISIGLVGAVDSGLNVGDIFIPEGITDFNNSVKIYKTAEVIKIRRGILVTVPKIFWKKDKEELKKLIPNASAVDMETSAIAEILEPLKIPLICIKAVCDEYEFDFENKIQLKKNIDFAIKINHEYLIEFLNENIHN